MERTQYVLKDGPFVPTHMGQIAKICDFDEFDTTFDKEIKNSIQKYYNGEPVDNISVRECDYQQQKIMLFSNEKETENLKSFQFLQIECEEETDIVLVPRSTAFQKVWVNYKLFSYLKKFNITYIVHLKKGKNILVFESGDVIKWHSLFVRISPYSYEQKAFPSCIFDKLKAPLDLGYTHYFDNRLYGDSKVFSFAFYPNNDLMSNKLVKADMKITQVFSNSKKLVYQDKVAPLVKNSYDLSDLSNSQNKYHYFVFELEYMYTNGVLHKERIEIYTVPFEKYKNSILKKAIKVLNTTKLHQFDSNFIKFYINKINYTKYPEEDVIVLHNKLKKLKKGKSFEVVYKKGGVHKIYYTSKLTESIMSTNVSIPQKYDNNKKYPLVIIFHTLNDLSADHFSNYCDEPIIAADINIQGINLGSYIGEACYREAFQVIKDIYNIDENRIYLTGYSNGGGASYLLAEANPGEYAGIHPIAAGGLNLSSVKNLFNLPVISVTSNNDSRHPIFKNAEKAFKESNNKIYEGYIAEEYTHISMGTLYFNQLLIKKLLSRQREEYPDTIRFLTHRNRHNKAYWVKIHSIEHKKIFAEINASISDNNIYIGVKNVTGFTVELPPQLHRFRFKIIINEVEVFNFYHYEKDCIHFIKDKDRFVVKKHIEAIDNYHKGNGLLDVYLNPLYIVKPDDSGEAYSKLADNFSNPSTNGYDTNIYIRYPVKTYSSFTESDADSNKCLIVIDNLRKNEFLKKIKANAIIKTNQKGYTYLGKKYEGKYCIMQIVSNPWNRNYKILLISANDKKMFQNNVFTRKVILPTYVGDYNSYWNNDALIFDGDSYYRILDNGMKIEKIKNQ